MHVTRAHGIYPRAQWSSTTLVCFLPFRLQPTDTACVRAPMISVIVTRARASSGQRHRHFCVLRIVGRAVRLARARAAHFIKTKLMR